MPARLRGFCDLGRFHHIEVEDRASAFLEWPDGATGTFIGSTGESPGTNRLEIVGSGGKLVLENNRLLFTRLTEDMTDFSRRAAHGFARPESTTIEIPIENASRPHATVLQNFVDAILDPGAAGTPRARRTGHSLAGTGECDSLFFAAWKSD